MMISTCCLTGHRPQKLSWGFNESDIKCLMLKEQIKKETEKAISLGYANFISGMALGCDMYFAEIILELKKTHPKIKLECAIPYEKQCVSWTLEQTKRYHNILNQCDKKTLISKAYTHSCLMERNQYMVDHSSLLIAVYSQNVRGGTYNTITYAKKKDIDIISIFI